jgi:hypothetical protein
MNPTNDRPGGPVDENGGNALFGCLMAIGLTLVLALVGFGIWMAIR